MSSTVCFSLVNPGNSLKYATDNEFKSFHKALFLIYIRVFRPMDLKII